MAENVEARLMRFRAGDSKINRLVIPRKLKLEPVLDVQEPPVMEVFYDTEEPPVMEVFHDTEQPPVMDAGGGYSRLPY